MSGPFDTDDRWQPIAERLESEYATGAKLLELAQEAFEDFDLPAAVVAIYEGHADDFAIASERLMRGLVGRLNDRIETAAREDAAAEVLRLDDEAAESHAADVVAERFAA